MRVRTYILALFLGTSFVAALYAGENKDDQSVFPTARNFVVALGEATVAGFLFNSALGSKEKLLTPSQEDQASTVLKTATEKELEALRKAENSWNNALNAALTKAEANPWHFNLERANELVTEIKQSYEHMTYDQVLTSGRTREEAIQKLIKLDVQTRLDLNLSLAHAELEAARSAYYTKSESIFEAAVRDVSRPTAAETGLRFIKVAGGALLAYDVGRRVYALWRSADKPAQVLKPTEEDTVYLNRITASDPSASRRADHASDKSHPETETKQGYFQQNPRR